jgi:phosphinothricin acetyltransferase
MELRIAPLVPADWARVRAIYQAGIASGNATFETEAPDWEDWDRRHLPVGRLTASRGDGIVGWVALSPTSTRRVYAGVAEVSIYVAPEAQGRGIGQALLEQLIVAAEQAGLWTLQAGVFPENRRSLALLERNGFRRIGYRERIGKHADGWRDVVLLERRSRSVGWE